MTMRQAVYTEKRSEWTADDVLDFLTGQEAEKAQENYISLRAKGFSSALAKRHTVFLWPIVDMIFALPYLNGDAPKWVTPEIVAQCRNFTGRLGISTRRELAASQEDGAAETPETEQVLNPARATLNGKVASTMRDFLNELRPEVGEEIVVNSKLLAFLFGNAPSAWTNVFRPSQTAIAGGWRFEVLDGSSGAFRAKVVERPVDEEERTQLRAAIAALEAQVATLKDRLR